MIISLTTTAILTRLIVNPAHPGARRDLRSIDHMHRTIVKFCCPPGLGPNSRSIAGVLYRVEETAAGTSVLVQSLTIPDPGRLPGGYAIGGTTDVGPLLDRLTIGMTVRYRIAASPTRCRVVPGKRGRVVGLRGDDALAWWHQRARNAGLELLAAELVKEQALTGDRERPAEPKHQLVHHQAQFDGIATITDPNSTRNAILAGVGRARAYGCGLISIAPMTDDN